MGVKRLYTFMKEHDLMTPVDIREEVKKHRLKLTTHSDPEPQVVIVVDTPCILHKFYEKLPWIYGGQWNELKRNVEIFIKQFNDIGVSLAFFFDGSVENMKRKKWVERRMQELRDNREIFDKVFYVNDVCKITSFKSDLPPNMLKFMKMQLKHELKQEVIASIGEGDRAVAEYGKRNNCLAILSDDTDFLIYDSIPCYSANALDINNLTTSIYNREKLCQVLNLDKCYLPVLAVLSGNDLLSPQQLRNIDFYNKINKISTWAIVNIANFLHHHHSCHKKHMDCNALAVKLEREWSGLKQLQFAKCVESYMFNIYKDEEEFLKCSLEQICGDKLSRVSNKLFEEIVRAHVFCEVFEALVVAIGGDGDVSTSLEDARTDLKPYGDVYKEIRSRSIGLVLGVTVEEAKAKSVWVKEWNMSSVDVNQYEATKIYAEPVLLYDSLCDIETLWFESSEDDKLATFWVMMGLPPDTAQRIPVPPGLYCPIAVIHYLYRVQTLLQLWEIKVLLVHMFMVNQLYNESIDECHDRGDDSGSRYKDLERVNGRALQIPVLFCRGVGRAMATLLLCRLHGYIKGNMPWHYFDGYRFHQLYLNMCDDQQMSLEQLAKNDVSVISNVEACVEFIETI